jgi:diguanylate cyclase (GGDEF)-like protein
MLAYQATAAFAASSGLAPDAVRAAGLVAASAAFLGAEAVVHLRHLDLADGLGEEIDGLGPRLLLEDSPGVALGVLVVALIAVSPITLVLVVPLGVLVVRSIRGQDALLRAGTDQKTGLLTLHSFRPVALSELSRARRHGRPLVAVMMDLDRMKAVNTDHGHLVGEKVLAAVGDLLSGSMRTEDVVARFGGDEFCLLLPDTAVEGGLAIVERLRSRIASSVLVDGAAPVRGTASFGVARLQVDDDVDALLERADSALRRAKAEGRDRVVVLD